VAEYGEHDKESVSVALSLDGADEAAAIFTLAKLKEVLCYRDAFGRLLFGIIPSVSRGARHFGAESSVVIVGIDYSEEV